MTTEKLSSNKAFISRTGKNGTIAHRRTFHGFAVQPRESALTLYLSAENLKNTLWEPDILEFPKSSESWGAWSWSLELEDGVPAFLTNNRRGGARWSIWVKNVELDSLKVEQALFDLIWAAGFHPKFKQDAKRFF